MTSKLLVPTDFKKGEKVYAIINCDNPIRVRGKIKNDGNMIYLTNLSSPYEIVTDRWVVYRYSRPDLRHGADTICLSRKPIDTAKIISIMLVYLSNTSMAAMKRPDVLHTIAGKLIELKND